MKKIFFMILAFSGLFAFIRLTGQETKTVMPRILIDGSRPDENSIQLKSMDIQVEIFGNLAKTTTTMVFTNSSNRNLEGNLLFPLPETATVSGYAIDINGKLRNAVPVAKARAVEVLESIQKQNVDPGILEKVEGNNFRTRISPIPTQGSRTVQISYYQVLKSDKSNYQYQLPLNSGKKISQFTLTTKVYQTSHKPILVESPDGSFDFSQNNHVYEASLSKTDFIPTKSLIIRLPQTKNKIESFTQNNVDGSVYFYAPLLQDIPSTPKVWSRNIGIIWDNSLSGLKRDHEKELQLIGKIVAQKKELNIEVSLVNINLEKGKVFQIKNGDWSELKQYLQTITYDGGTNYSKINSLSLKADEYLMFSDGISSFGSSEFYLNKPIYTISSSSTSNLGTLKYIAQKTRGKFVNLNEESVDQAFTKLNRNKLQFLGIKNETVSEVYPMLGTEVDQDFSVSGISKSKNSKLIILLGRNGKVEIQKEIDLENSSQSLEISKIWAQQKIDFLEMNAEKNKEEIEQIGKQFSIVTAHTSFIVLENVSDYVKYQINPPAELQEEYNQLIKQGWAQKETRKSDLLQKAIAKAKELQEWWKKDFNSVKPKYPQPAKDNVVANLGERDLRRNVSSISTNMIAGDFSLSEMRQEAPSAKMEASNNKMIKKKMDRVVPEIKIIDIKSDKEYVKLIEASKSPYDTYLELRKEYIETPSFYFDVASYFFQKKDKVTGLKILSSLADLGLENAELYKMLAYKLKEIEEYPAELFVTKKVLDWRPFDAQSYRDYALALQDNKQYQEALEHLYKVLTNDYSVEIANRDRDITEIIVPEINNLVSLYPKELNFLKIDSKILVDIPVDIRVVMNWNKDMTDIDLWVTDPNGEKCYYGHRATAIGGRNSEDVTQGFGPEQFMLKKAIPGKYKIQTNFFAERQMSITGPTTISVEIFLMYSSGKQTKKMITFQNNNPDRGNEGILIGEFEF